MALLSHFQSPALKTFCVLMLWIIIYLRLKARIQLKGFRDFLHILDFNSEPNLIRLLKELLLRQVFFILDICD